MKAKLITYTWSVCPAFFFFFFSFFFGGSRSPSMFLGQA